MKITWVNHASFILEKGSVRLLVDPWFEGRVFDESWELLAPSQFTCEDFDSVTHIWFSHEHPDHFSPPILKKVSDPAKNKVQVLFQETKDKKVLNFCKKLGFKNVCELEKDNWYELGEGLKILCNPSPLWGDSWLCAKTKDLTLLNINDCVVNSKGIAQEIKEVVGRVDVLMTQFSYACHVGNKGDDESHKRWARDVLNNVILQTKEFEPKYVIPFASFVWFCHEDNFYMNKNVNTVDDAVRAIRENTPATPVILYPGNQWELSHEFLETKQNIDAYNRDAAMIGDPSKVVKRETIKLEELTKEGLSFLRTLRKINKTIFLYKMEPTKIYLEDHQTALKFSFFGIHVIDEIRENCDISLNSDALCYCFKFLWGGDTLFVNGRYFIPPGGVYKRFRSYFSLASSNNRGEKAHNLFDRIKKIFK